MSTASMQPSPVLAQFTSHSTPVDVYVQLGFIPAYLELMVDVDGTNSNEYRWAEVDDLSMWPNDGETDPATDTIVIITGSSGIRTKDSTAGEIIERYTGGDKIAADETVATDPTHVSIDGTPASEGDITSAGVLIPAEIQVASAVNILKAFRKG